MSGLRTWFGRGMDQDWVDRANGFWSVLLLSVCSVAAFLARYLTVPISCWTPAHFEDAHNVHAMETCLHKDVYYSPFQMGRPDNEIKDQTMSYHLWIPLILFIQALCFKIPNIIWSTCRRCITINLDETVETLKQSQLTKNRKSMFQDAARILDGLLKRNNFFLGVLYLVVKLLYLLNLIGQFLFVTIFFRNTLLLKAGNYIHFDYESFLKPLFIKNVLCVYDVRMAKLQRYVIQCTLSITDVYEKMYVFLWYWIFFLAVATCINLLLWAGFLFIPSMRNSRISTYINASQGPSKDSSQITRFISSSLGFDGAFLVSMISQNSSETVAANLSQEMYQVFLEKDRPMPQDQPVASSSAPPELDPGSETVEMTELDLDNNEKLPMV